MRSRIGRLWAPETDSDNTVYLVRVGIRRPPKLTRKRCWENEIMRDIQGVVNLAVSVTCAGSGRRPLTGRPRLEVAAAHHPRHEGEGGRSGGVAPRLMSGARRRRRSLRAARRAAP